jgi:hypothetical protein
MVSPLFFREIATGVAGQKTVNALFDPPAFSRPDAGRIQTLRDEANDEYVPHLFELLEKFQVHSLAGNRRRSLEIIRKYLPGTKPHLVRPQPDPRGLINGILYVLTACCTLADVTEKFGTKSTVHRNHLEL